MAAVAKGTKAYFAGGVTGQGSQTLYTSRVDIYDAGTSSWSQAELSQARGYLAAATHASTSKIYFAGGFAGADYGRAAELTFSDRVDVYDSSSNSWSILQLSQGRGGESYMREREREREE